MNQDTVESCPEVVVDLNEKKPIRVLHVDDEPTLLMIAKQCLEMEGPFQVETVSSVDQALEKINAESYDVIISDLQMPGKDGLELLKELRKEGNDIPFIIFTGKGREEMAIKALKLGADGYFNKTGDPETVYGELGQGIRSSVEEKRAKEKINALVMEKELILQSTAEGVFGLDESGKIRFINASAERMLGWKESELLGRSSHETLHHTRINGKPYPERECISFRVLKNGIAQKMINEVFWRKDGTSFPVEYSVSPIWKKGKIAGAVESFRDITERKKAEEELFYQAGLLQNVSNAIIATDLNFEIKSWNKAAEEIYGWKEKEVIGKNLKDVTKIKYLNENEEQVVERFSREGRWEGEIIEKRKNGSSINVFAAISLIKARTGDPTGLVAVNRDITERKKMEETLLASLDRYRSFIEVTGELGWTTNADGEVVEDVPSFRKFTGQTYEEARGWGWSKALHFDDLERTTLIWKEATRTKSKYEVEYRLRRHDGVYRYFMARGVPVFEEDGSIREWVGTCIDITERKEAEETFRKSAEQARSLLEFQNKAIDTALVWFNLLDAEGNVTLWNRAAELISGYTREEVIGHNRIWEWLYPDPRYCAFCFTRAKNIIGDKLERNFETEIRCKNGASKTILWYTNSIADGKGKPIGSIAIGLDVSELKKADRELQEATEKLQAMNEKLRVVGGLTRHDMRNKLAAITGSIYLMKKKLADNPDVLENFNDVQLACDQIEGIFEFARDYEKLGVEKLALVDVGTMVDKAAGSFPDLKGAKIVNECHGLVVLADTLLQRLFCNLIDNSLKYNGKLTQIRIRHKESEDGLRLIYEDDGVGIPKDAKPRVFTEGFTTGKGSGYGLYLIKKMVEIYGWAIQETGTPGKGAQFTITIPKAKKDEKKRVRA